MKYFLTFLIIISIISFGAAYAYAAQPAITVPQGGTGTSTVPANWVVIGKDALHLTAVATSSLGITTFGYLFPNNSTSTLLNFNGGITAYASSTIGNGTQRGGLTINGGATTTGNAYFRSGITIGTTTIQEAALTIEQTTGQGIGVFANAGQDASILLQNSNGIGWAIFTGNSGNTDGTADAFSIYGPLGPVFTAASSTGYIGIGTTTPDSQLSVYGDSVDFGRAGKYMYFNPNYNENNEWAVLSTGADAAPSTMGLWLQAGGDDFSNGVAITSGGNVGIGTTSPQSTLHVNGPGSGNFGGYPALAVLETPDDNPYSLVFKNDTVGSNFDVGFYINPAGRFTLGMVANNANPIMDWQPSLSGYGTTTAYGDFIVGDGNVGIGTPTPSAPLTVQNSPDETGIQIVAYNGVSNFNFLDSDGVTVRATLGDVNTGDNDFRIFSGDGSKLFLGSNDETGFFTIDTTGNVGVGSTSPFAKLSIDTRNAPATPLAIRTTGSLGNYVATSTGIFVYDAAGQETLRIVATDPDDTNNYNSGNLFIGRLAGASNPSDNLTAGFDNTGVGVEALTSNTTGYDNSAFGPYALQRNTTGFSNIAMGYFAAYHNTTGNNNTVVGDSSLDSNTTGSNNTAIGSFALGLNLSATNTVAIGYYAASHDGPGGDYHNQGGTYVGYRSGNNADNDSDYNTFLGYQSGYNVSTGSNNIIIGTATSSTAVANLTTGSQNILIGNNISFPSATASGQLNIGNILFGTGITGTGSRLSTGKIGVGTSTPRSKLTVNGDIGTDGANVTVSSCGSGAAVTVGSTDTAGEVTEGTLATGCVISFATTKTNPPFCTVSSEAGLAFSYSDSTTAITAINIGALSSTKITYHCVQNDL